MCFSNGRSYAVKSGYTLFKTTCRRLEAERWRFVRHKRTCEPRDRAGRCRHGIDGMGGDQLEGAGRVHRCDTDEK